MGNLGLDYFNSLANLGYANEIAKCIHYLYDMFICKAKKEYNSELENDKEFKQLYDRSKINAYIPKKYKDDFENDATQWDLFSKGIIDGEFKFDAVRETTANSIMENDFKAITNKYIDMKSIALEYLKKARLRIGYNKFGNTSEESYLKYNWLFHKSNTWEQHINRHYNGDQKALNCGLCLVLAMLIDESTPIKVWDREYTPKDVSNNLIDAVRTQAIDLMSKIGIDLPRNYILYNSKNMMYLLLTAFGIDDKTSEEEKSNLRIILRSVIIGKDTPHQKYLEDLWEETNKNDLLPDHSLSLSDYYVLPTLEGIEARKNNQIKYLIEAPTDFGKTTFLRAIMAVALKEIMLDDSDDKTRLNELSKKINNLFKTDFSEYMPIYINSMSINVTPYENFFQKMNDPDNENKPCILDYSVDSANKYKNVKRDLAKEGSILLLVDGLDEICDSQHRQMLTKLINVFLDDHENCSYILASRPINTDDFKDDQNKNNFLSNATKISITLDEDCQKEIIRKWTNICANEATDPEEKQKEIQKAVIDNKMIGDLCENPALLGYSVQELTKHADYRRCEIINKIVEHLIKKKTEEEYDKIREIEACLAYNLVINPEPIGKDDLKDKYVKILEQIRSIDDRFGDTKWDDDIMQISTRAGLVIFENDEYRFKSETIKLYLASEYLMIKIYKSALKKGEVKQENLTGIIANEVNMQISDLRSKCSKCWQEIVKMMLTPKSIKNAAEINTHKKTINEIINYLIILGTCKLDAELVKQISEILYCRYCSKYAKSYNDDPRAKEKEEEEKKHILRFLMCNRKVIGEDLANIAENKYSEITKKLQDMNFI